MLLKASLYDKVNNFIVLNICKIELFINKENLYGDISTKKRINTTQKIKFCEIIQQQLAGIVFLI